MIRRRRCGGPTIIDRHLSFAFFFIKNKLIYFRSSAKSKPWEISARQEDNRRFIKKKVNESRRIYLEGNEYDVPRILPEFYNYFEEATEDGSNVNPLKKGKRCVF